MQKQFRSKRVYASVIAASLLISGCSSTNTENSKVQTQTDSATLVKELHIYMISWKDPYGNGGKCETGLEVASFWYDGSSVSVYDSDSGNLLATATLNSSKNDPKSRICSYRATVSAKETQNYRFVFEKGRLQVTQSLSDLKIMADQYPLGDLVFVYELGA